MGDYEINYGTIVSAKAAWADQADQLRGAVASIDEVDSSSVGPRAAGALAVFCDHWADRLRAMQTQAQGNADALGDISVLSLAIDQEAVTSMTGLLPYQA